MLRSCLCLLVLLLAARVGAAETAPALAGDWKIDLARGTELSPWKDYLLTITVDGDTVTLHRRLAWASREFSDQLTVRIGQTVTAPVEMWPDNRHLGAYISSAHTKRVHATWLDGRRLLRLSTDLVLETQQGSRDVNILGDYKVSASGQELTLTELRSTRNRPIVYVFTRAASASK